MRVLSQFMMAATDRDQFPAPLLPEVAFLGRSNVGKSSTINSLVGSKVARTSSSPGRTQSINFFQIRWPGKPDPEMVFTDLPGYGYARVSREVSQRWPEFIEPYLLERPCLALCIVLIDISVPQQASDKQLVEFLQGTNRKLLIVATKSDRLSGNQLNNAVKRLASEYSSGAILPYSARLGTGRNELWQEIRRAVQDFRTAHA
jgi:GTP-binding protein